MHNIAISFCELNPGGSFRGPRKRSEFSCHIQKHSNLNGILPAFNPDGIKVHWPPVLHYGELICLHIKTLLKDWGQSLAGARMLLILEVTWTLGELEFSAKTFTGHCYITSLLRLDHWGGDRPKQMISAAEKTESPICAFKWIGSLYVLRLNSLYFGFYTLQ